ncbi:MAG: hypothetical protein CM1200mP2_47540 [Planctomycetaceae bacterium]|nr:MAG: hypothetical protein CM1200mP2_47540 [Planctomycetaceae bacterium]
MTVFFCGADLHPGTLALGLLQRVGNGVLPGMSFVRLSIDAHAGDRTATRILWFVQHPSAFVATTLVGNNVANFLTAQGVTLAIAALVASPGAAWEIGSVLAISPSCFSSVS